MNEEILNEYASLKVKIKEMTKKADELKPVVLETIRKSGEKNIKKDYGTFVDSVRIDWEYSDKINETEEKLKIMKVDEQEKGIAKAKESHFVTFKVKK